MNVNYEGVARRVAWRKLQLEQQSRGKSDVQVPADVHVFQQIAQSNRHNVLNRGATPFQDLMNALRKDPDLVVQEEIRKIPFTGSDALKNYTVKPWPPSVTSLEAFKTLLLERRPLIARAGGLLNPPPGATTERVETTHSGESEETASMNQNDVAQNAEDSSPVSASDAEFTNIRPKPNSQKAAEPCAPIVVQIPTKAPVSVAIKAERGAVKDNNSHTQSVDVTSSSPACDSPSDAQHEESENVTVVTLSDGTQISVAVVTEDAPERDVTPQERDTAVPDTPTEPQPSTSAQGAEPEQVSPSATTQQQATGPVLTVSSMSVQTAHVLEE